MMSAMSDHQPIQNSEVYLIIPSQTPSAAPPSPPSPGTPCELEMLPSAEDLMSLSEPELELKAGPPCKKRRLDTAVHVLHTEATALSCLTRHYGTDPIARSGFNAAVEAITRYEEGKGKLVITGIGKSGHIAKKLVATMNSLQIHATYLHPTEALHGDLGKVGKHDTFLFITYSGKTPELIQLLPHVNPDLPIIVMTSHTHPSTCAIASIRPDVILLPSPIHTPEAVSFGVSAPTTSTTIALALGDALAVAISRELHSDVSAVFHKNHPGGAIGAAIPKEKENEKENEKDKDSRKLSELSVSLVDIPEVSATCTGAHVLMAAYQSPSGWVRQGTDILISPRAIKKLKPDDLEEPASMIKGLMVHSRDWIEMPTLTSLSPPGAQGWIKSSRRSMLANRSSDEGAIVVLMDDDEVCGVMELGDLE